MNETPEMVSIIAEKKETKRNHLMKPPANRAEFLRQCFSYLYWQFMPFLSALIFLFCLRTHRNGSKVNYSWENIDAITDHREK